jgi:hypothetical protein
MRVPGDVRGTPNAYLAFRAVIRAVKRWNGDCVENGQPSIDSVLCPGLGTMIGKMDPNVAAFQMAQAYKVCHLGLKYSFGDLGAAWSMHEMLVSGTNLVG